MSYISFYSGLINETIKKVASSVRSIQHEASNLEITQRAVIKDAFNFVKAMKGCRRRDPSKICPILHLTHLAACVYILSVLRGLSDHIHKSKNVIKQAIDHVSKANQFIIDNMRH